MNAAVQDTLIARLPHGVRMHVRPGDHISRALLRGLYYEGVMLDYIRRSYPRGMTVVDAGAHIGNHSLFLARVCGCRVLAFEADAGNFDLLALNVLLNGPVTVEAFHVALGAEPAFGVPMPAEPGNSGMARIVPDPAAGTVRIMPLDMMLKTGPGEVEKIDLMKIDVEGMEADVLRGAGRILKAHHPALFVECKTDDDQATVLEVIAPYGYRPTGRVFNHSPTFEFTAAPK